jgi:hypothetical protein
MAENIINAHGNGHGNIHGNVNGNNDNGRNPRCPTPLPWGDNIGPLALQGHHELPKGSRKKFPQFLDDGAQHPDEHISSFMSTCSILHVPHDDISVHLFVETLKENATERFHHLELGIITSWAVMSKKFLARFKPVEDSHQLLAQLSNSKIKKNEPMRKFVARFNHLVTRLTHMLDISEGIFLRSFINVLPSKITFFLKSAHEIELLTAQERAIEIEDNMVTSRKMKTDSIKLLV